uniref:Odorant binding protein 4 n=1 Tax=Cyrtorhinus lividipennis TaxID=1032904 RepID=A0A1W6AWH7_9HEMI|nr:odorant binding protein 4 [Cyrtorhinus lividipennis]
MTQLLCAVLVVVLAAATVAEDAANAMVMKAFKKCRDENPIGDDEMAKVKEKVVVPDSHNAKCLMACMLREGKMLRNGKYLTENALVMADILSKDNDEMAEKSKKLVETCAGSVGVDAGGDECEFAYKMALCAAAEAKKLGIHPPDF